MPCASDGRAGCLQVLALLCGVVAKVARPRAGKTRPRIRRALCGVDLVRFAGGHGLPGGVIECGRCPAPAMAGRVACWCWRCCAVWC